MTNSFNSKKQPNAQARLTLKQIRRMKTPKKTKLKSQSAENEQQCWDALIESVAINPQGVLIDAIRSKDGEVNYRIYRSSDDDNLEMFGVALLYFAPIRDSIVSSEHGRKTFYLASGSDGDLPSMMATVGKRNKLSEKGKVLKRDRLPYGAISVAVPTERIISKLNDTCVDLTKVRCFVGAD